MGDREVWEEILIAAKQAIAEGIELLPVQQTALAEYLFRCKKRLRELEEQPTRTFMEKEEAQELQQELDSYARFI